MRFGILSLVLLSATAAFAGPDVDLNPVPTSGLYEIVSGGETSSTCPSVDRRQLRNLPWWVVNAVGTSGMSLREANSFTSGVPSGDLWGNISLKGGGYGLYEGDGYMVWRRFGPQGPCSLRRDIHAKVNTFSDGTLWLDATVKVTHRNPDFEGQNCEVYGLPQCEYAFHYELKLTDGGAGIGR